MFGQIIDDIIGRAFDRTAVCSYMSAAAKKDRNLTYVHNLIGPHTHFKFQRFLFRQQNSHFDSLCSPEFINDSIKI